MRKIKTEEAVGQALAHDVTAMYDGFKGALFKRGHIIEEKDIPALLDIGKKTVYVGEADEGLLHEEDCAVRLSEMVQVPGHITQALRRERFYLFPTCRECCVSILSCLKK